MSLDDEKRLAAEAAAELVESGMTVGLGTGSTLAPLLPALARRGLTGLRCVATSVATEDQARSLGIPVEDFDSLSHLDIAIDGADEVTPDGWLIKGGGGAHLREKIVAAAADRFVVIGDSTKPVEELTLAGGLRRGGGGAHLREKIVAAAADRFVVIGDSTKPVEKLTWPVPLELFAFGLASTLARLRDDATV